MSMSGHAGFAAAAVGTDQSMRCPSQEARVSRRELLTQPSLIALLAAEVISTTGSQMTWLALPWFVLVTTGSATKTSLVIAAELGGLALLGLPGGKLLGRLGARRTMIFCDSARAPVMLVIPVLHWSGGLSFALLLLVAFALGALSAPYFSAQKVIVPELLGEGEQEVTDANALFQAANRTTILAGPVIGGILIGAIGAPSVLLVDGASYVVSVLLVWAFVPRRPPVEQEPEHRQIRAGLRFLARDRLLRVWWPAFALGDAAWTAFFVTVPVLVLGRFGHHPQLAGWLFASFGIGAVIGNAVSFRYLTRRFDGLTIFATFIVIQVAPLWLLWLPLPAVALSAILIVSGLGNGLVNPSLHSISTLRIPAPMRPTVMTTVMVLWALVNPLGLFVAGPVLDAFGTTPVLIGYAAVQTVTMSSAAFVAVRERVRQRAEPAPAF
jgi:predicted MFS family arabinose efflux permease